MWWRRRRSDEDFAAEVRAHLENEADRLVGEGMTPRRGARRGRTAAFGNVDPRARALPRRAPIRLGRTVRARSALRLARVASEPRLCRHHGPDARGRHGPRDGRLRHLQRLRAAPVRRARSVQPLRDSVERAGGRRRHLSLARLRGHPRTAGSLRRRRRRGHATGRVDRAGRCPSASSRETTSRRSARVWRSDEASWQTMRVRPAPSRSPS